MYTILWRWGDHQQDTARVTVSTKDPAAAIVELLEVLELPYTVGYTPALQDLPF